MLKQAKGFWPAWMRIGDAYLAESRPLEAAEAYDKARLLGSPEAESMAKIGSALLAAGRLEDAAERLTTALGTGTLSEEDSARARYFLGLALVGVGDLEGARELVYELGRKAEHQELRTKLMRFMAEQERE